METPVGWRSTANNPPRTCKKEETTTDESDDERLGGGCGDDKDPALDRLATAHSGLSELIGQIDELVGKGIERKLADKMDRGHTESFIQFLSNTHLSLKNAFGSSDEGDETQSDKTSGDNVTDAFDEVVSPSPLVSWSKNNCKVESGGKQLFLLTPLPRSKQPPASRVCGPDFLNCSVKKMIHKTPSSIVRPPLPSTRKFPCEGVVAAEMVEANETTKTKKIKFRKGTPFVKYDKKSKHFNDLDYDEFIVDLTSRYPKLLENSVILEQPTPHSKNLHEQGLKLDFEADDITPIREGEEEEEMGSSDWKGKGESTLKKDLWTKFEALSVVSPHHMQGE